MMQIRKATRQQLRLRVGLMGPSGSGKTYSALLMARGLGAKVLLVDTEAGRSEVYANEFEFDVLPLEPPFSPERYIEAITTGGKAGYEVIIVDSISHEWMGSGGILDSKEKMPDKSDWSKWAKLTPRHNAFVEALVRAPAHMLLTVRGKDTWILELDSKGKQKPKKVGVGGQQREGMEYEFTCAFILDQETHVATATKDNTHLFEHVYDALSTEAGRQLRAWAQDGAPATPQGAAPPAGQQAPQEPGSTREELLALLDNNVTLLEWHTPGFCNTVRVAEAKKHRTPHEWYATATESVRNAIAKATAARAEATAERAAETKEVDDDFDDDIPWPIDGDGDEATETQQETEKELVQ